MSKNIKFAYTPKNHLRTIMCNMAPTVAHVEIHILDMIKEELLSILERDNVTMEDCKMHHIKLALRNTNNYKYWGLYHHYIYYTLTNKPKPVITLAQEHQIMDYFEKNQKDYLISPNHFYKFEDIIKDIDKILGFDIFPDL